MWLHVECMECEVGGDSGIRHGLIAFQIVRTQIARYSKFNSVNYLPSFLIGNHSAKIFEYRVFKFNGLQYCFANPVSVLFR